MRVLDEKCEFLNDEHFWVELTLKMAPPRRRFGAPKRDSYLAASDFEILRLEDVNIFRFGDLCRPAQSTCSVK